jgi:hypothetical protein
MSGELIIRSDTERVLAAMPATLRAEFGPMTPGEIDEVFRYLRGVWGDSPRFRTEGEAQALAEAYAPSLIRFRGEDVMAALVMLAESKTRLPALAEIASAVKTLIRCRLEEAESERLSALTEATSVGEVDVAESLFAGYQQRREEVTALSWREGWTAEKRRAELLDIDRRFRSMFREHADLFVLGEEAPTVVPPDAERGAGDHQLAVEDAADEAKLSDPVEDRARELLARQPQLSRDEWLAETAEVRAAARALRGAP